MQKHQFTEAESRGFQPQGQSCAAAAASGNNSYKAKFRVGLIAVVVNILLQAGGHQLCAQTTEFGAINGTVTDSTQHVIPGVHVTAINAATNERFTAETNASGQYGIFNLLPLRYEVVFEAPGFKEIMIAPFKLDVGQNVTQNAILQPGATSETVRVNAQGQLLETTVVGNSTTVEAQQINDLPLNGRNYVSLIDLTPGVDGTRVNGQFSDGNRFLADGANNTTLTGATSAYVPNLDLIQEFSIDSQSMKADEGGYEGGTISVATKSGTNQLKGDLWEFGRNNEFVARNPLVNLPGVPFPPYHLNQYGIVVGGPVYVPRLYDGHDKTFFEFGFQRFTQTEKLETYGRVPTADELNGIFTNSLFFLASPGIQHLYDPASTTNAANPTRSPFPNDVIPSGRLDQTVVGFLKFWLPPPNFTPNAKYPTSNRLDLLSFLSAVDDESLRIDHRFSTRDNVFARYSQVSNEQNSPITLGFSTTVNNNRKDLVVDWVHTFNPKLFVESNYAYMIFPLRGGYPLPNGATGTLEKDGFSATNINTYGAPCLSNIGLEQTCQSLGYYEKAGSPVSLAESLSWTPGKHSFKFGTTLSHKDFNNIGGGQWYYGSTIPTENPNQNAPNAGNTGNALASMLLGLPSSYDFSYQNYTEAYMAWAVYAEDLWKIRPHVTVDLGLRYDSYPVPNFVNPGGNDVLNDWDAFNGIWYLGGGKVPPACNVSGIAPCIPGDGNIADLPYGNMIQVAPYSGIRHPNHDNWGPRVGVAWSIFPNTVFRAGYGIYYDLESNLVGEDQNIWGNWPQETQRSTSYNAIGAPLTSIQQIDSQLHAPVTTGVPWGTQSAFWDPTKKDPRSQQYNIGVEQQFGKETVATVSYVGMLLQRSDMFLDANTATTPGPGDAATVNARRPWPFYGTDTRFGTDFGRASLNSLQAKLQRNFSNGFETLISYTFGKLLDNGESNIFGGQPENSYDLDRDYGPSNADRRHLLSMSAIYQLPFGKGKQWLNHGVYSYILGGFQFNAIGIAESGNPIVMQTGGDPANIGNTQYNYDRPNLIGNPHVAHPTSQQWFNQAAFAQPAYSYGTASRGILYNPGYQDADLSAFKNISVHEDWYLQLRVEAFNALNLITRGGVDGYLTNNPTFGQIHSIGSTPRQLQFAAKFYF